MNQFDFLGRGMNFPPGAGRADGRFLLETGEEGIRRSIHLILLTKPGERVMRPEFGCHIWQYLFEVPDASMRARMKKAVEDALILWEPRIRDVNAQVTELEGGRLGVEININYVVRATNNPYNLVYPFYMEEGLLR